jgi:hypothetical protein
MTKPAKGSKEYTAWCNMKSRCNNPSNPVYPRYGGRGIYVDDSLVTFEKFFAVLGTAPASTSLDRIDNDGPYSAGNVRWADKKTQMRNRSDNRFITFDGKTQTLADWAAEINMSTATLWARFKYGYTVEEALSSRLLTLKESSALGHSARWGAKL